MALLDEKKFRAELSAKSLRGVYFLSCEDPLKLEYAFSDLKKASGTTQAKEIETYYGDELESMQLQEACQTDSLWASQKCIVVREAHRINAKKWDQLQNLCLQKISGTLLIFLAEKFDGRLKFFQSLAKTESDVVLVKLAMPDIPEWNQWLKLFLKELNREVSPDARELLLDWTYGSLHDLRTTLEKACLYAPAQKIISREQLQAVGVKLNPQDVFAFTGALLSGNRDSALFLLNAILAQGEEPIGLLALLSRQYRWLLQILCHRAEGKSDFEIASQCKIFPSAAKVLFPASKRLNGKSISEALQLLAQTDLHLKLSKVPPAMTLAALVEKLT